jgi:Polysaccharide lyase
VPGTEPADRHEVLSRLGGQEPESDVVLAAPLQRPRTGDAMGAAIDQNLQHQPRVIRRATPHVAFELTRSNPIGVMLRARGQGLSGGRPTWSGEWNLGGIRTNAWVDFVVYITWSTNPRVGHITVKINGRQAANTAAAAVYPGMSGYMKQGIYRANSMQTQTIYHAGTRRGPTLASVAR